MNIYVYTLQVVNLLIALVLVMEVSELSNQVDGLESELVKSELVKSEVSKSEPSKSELSKSELPPPAGDLPQVDVIFDLENRTLTGVSNALREDYLNVELHFNMGIKNEKGYCLAITSRCAKSEGEALCNWYSPICSRKSKVLSGLTKFRVVNGANRRSIKLIVWEPFFGDDREADQQMMICEKTFTKLIETLRLIAQKSNLRGVCVFVGHYGRGGGARALGESEERFWLRLISSLKGRSVSRKSTYQKQNSKSQGRNR